MEARVGESVERRLPGTSAGPAGMNAGSAPAVPDGHRAVLPYVREAWRTNAAWVGCPPPWAPPMCHPTAAALPGAGFQLWQEFIKILHESHGSLEAEGRETGLERDVKGRYR